MNNLQLFRMYQWFRHKQETTCYNHRFDNDIGGTSARAFAEWGKWFDLSCSARKELEKRLTPPPPYDYHTDMQRQNDAIPYWEQFGLNVPD